MRRLVNPTPGHDRLTVNDIDSFHPLILGLAAKLIALYVYIGMEPLSAIGLAANIIQFVEVGINITSGAVEIYRSTDGSTSEDATLQAVAAELKNWSFQFSTQSCSSAQSEEEKAIYRLSSECQKISKDLLELITKTKTKPKDKGSKRAATSAAIKENWYKDDKRKLQNRLETCRNQLATQLGSLDRSFSAILRS